MINTALKIGIDIDVQGLDFALENFQDLIRELFKGRTFEFSEVEDWEDSDLDFHFSLNGLNYKDEAKKYHCLILEIACVQNGKEITLEIDGKEYLSAGMLDTSLYELMILAKVAVEREIIA